MKKKIVLGAVSLIILGAILYWQSNKKWFVRKGIENAISKSTEGVYRLHYDSSSIDETAGNASFYNISMQSDSMQELLYKNDTTGLNPSIFNIKAKEVSVRGMNLTELVRQSSVEAAEILIDEPQFHIINTGKKSSEILTHEDTMVLYKRLIGNFSKILAQKITIRNGTFKISNGREKPHTILENICVTIKDFLIDSTRDYHNVLSYFVKDVVVTASSLRLINPKHTKQLVAEGIEYNAPGRFMQLNRFYEQRLSADSTINYELKATRVSNLYTDDFVLNRKFKADSFTCNGGTLVVYKDKSKENGSKGKLEIDNDYVTQLLIKNVRLKKTNLFLLDKQNPNSNPLLIKNLEFSAWDIANIDSVSTLAGLLSTSKWKISTDGLSIFTKDNLYRIDIGRTIFDKSSSKATIEYLALVPTKGEAAFFSTQNKQKDYYNIRLTHIALDGFNIVKLLTSEDLIATTLTVKSNITVSSDRTLPPDVSSKAGKYPQQMLMKLNLPINIGKVILQNGLVQYKEKSKLSGEYGVISFKNINGIVTNVCNIKELLSNNKELTLQATGKFANVATFNTSWKLPLQVSNGAFSIEGNIESFNAPNINNMVAPLGMATFKSGTINSLKFSMTGNDDGVQGNTTLLYNNLKVTLLQAKNQNPASKKQALSFLANMFIKNDNPTAGVIRSNSFTIQRDKTRSFFNLMWQGIFTGVKKTVSGKNS